MSPAAGATAPAPTAKPVAMKRAVTDWAFTSPRRCWNARPRRSTYKGGSFPTAAPSSACIGRAAISSARWRSPAEPIVFRAKRGPFRPECGSPFRLFTCGRATAFLGYMRAIYSRIRRCGRLCAVAETTDRGAEASMADLMAAAMPSDRSLLIVEDDKSFLQRLARAMEGRGFTVTTAESVADGLAQLETASPAFAVVDMRLEDGNGLDVISALKRRRPDARAIILTGYGNIATAVNAVKLGAVDYLSKPVDADDVVAALLALEGRKAEPPENPMSADRVRWEHIQRIYELCGRNVSETARRLNMHRRTLQRILAKRAPK